MPAHKQTLYQILGVAPDAAQADIAAAHDRRVAELQAAAAPDANALAIVHEAYGVLRNPERRRAYDASLAATRERAEAEAQADAELVIEEVDPQEARRRSWPILAAIAALAIVVIYYALRPARIPDPQSAPPPVAEAPQPQPQAPAPPPPPVERTAADILKEATGAAGRLSSVEMSGRATPLGVALAVEPGSMITTCHGIPAGSKLVVHIGKDTYPADLAITDERLDLCRLTVPGLSGKTLGIARDEPVAGSKIFALGVSAAGEFALTEGTVKQVRSTPEGAVLELSMPIAPGGSGGAVFDAQGRIAGIATTQYLDVKGASLALPASWIARMRSRGAS